MKMRGGSGKQSFYLADKLKKVGVIFFMAFLYDFPLVQTTCLFLYANFGAGLTFFAAPYNSLSRYAYQFLCVSFRASFQYFAIPQQLQ